MTNSAIRQVQKERFLLLLNRLNDRDTYRPAADELGLVIRVRRHATRARKPRKLRHRRPAGHYGPLSAQISRINRCYVIQVNVSTSNCGCCVLYGRDKAEVPLTVSSERYVWPAQFIGMLIVRISLRFTRRESMLRAFLRC